MQHYGLAWVFFFSPFVFTTQAQTVEQNRPNDEVLIRAMAVRQRFVLPDMNFSSDDDLDNQLEIPGISIRFQVEGADFRYLVSTGLVSIVGPAGEKIILAERDVGESIQDSRVSIGLINPLLPNRQRLGGWRGFAVAIQGEKQAKTSRFHIRGKAKVAVGGVLKKLVVELDSETCKKIRVGPFQCMYLDDFEKDKLEYWQEKLIKDFSILDDGLVFCVLRACQVLSGKGNVIDALGGIFVMKGCVAGDLVRVIGPVQLIQNVSDEDENLYSKASLPGRLEEFQIQRKKPGKRRITLEYWDQVEMKELPFEFKGG